MTMRRFALAVALIALDLASIRGGYNVNLMVAVPILQIGLFRILAANGTIRPFWVGFGAFGWVGVLVCLSRVGQVWNAFLINNLADAVTRIEEFHPATGRALAMVILCEGTPIEDTIPGLLPQSLLAGLPILILGLLGGLLAS